MFDHLFENRNATVTNLLKLGDCLGRSLRENVELFSIDSENKKVAYLSEGGKVISGEYSFDKDLSLQSISIQESDIFTNNEIFNTHVEDRVSTFVGGLNSSKYGEADESFMSILSLWENRLKFENVKKRLQDKTEVFSESQNIVNTTEFQRFLEIMPQIVEFLEEQRETIEKVKEIENAIKLSNSVSKAFNFPRISYETLEEDGTYTISKGFNKSVYELICKQELVKKELLESKKNFEDVWATNPHIRNLASLIFEDSDEKVLENLVEAVVDVPYLALTTKKQLLDSISNAFSLTENTAITTKDLKSYVSKLFEMKKPLKQVILNILNEKYGINVQNLKNTATFTGLANTQVVIFESLTRLAPKGSVVKDTLADLSKLLKNKNGVEVIDVNDVLQECFEVCNYDNFCEDYTLIENISFDTLLEETHSVEELLEKAKEKLLFDKKRKDVAGDSTDNLSPEQAKGKKDAEKHEKHPSSEADLEDDSVRASEASAPFSKPAPFSPEGGEGEDDGEEGEEEGEEKPKAEGKKKKKMKEESEPAPQPEAPEAEMEPQPEVEPMSKDEFLETLKDMDELLTGLSDEEEDEEVDSAETDEMEA